MPRGPAAGDNAAIRNHANLIWGVAELLRGDYKQADNADLAAQAGANSKEDFVRHRDDLLIGAAMDVTVDREKQAPLLKALLDDEDFRARASRVVMEAIYEGLREGGSAGA